MMIRLVQWLEGLPRRWLALFVVITVSAANLLFLPLDGDVDELPVAAKYRAIDLHLSADVGGRVAHIRQLGIWVVSSGYDAGRSAESTAENKEAGGSNYSDDGNWQLLGIISSEAGREAVLRQGTRYLYSVIEGDHLPSGEQVSSLGHDYLTLSDGDTQTKLLLYPFYANDRE